MVRIEPIPLMKKISFVFGSRPEAVKLCPVILALRKLEGFQAHVCVTAQHRQMLDQVLEVFDIRPDVDLNLMQPDQSLSELTARALRGLDRYYADYRPDLVIVQGDTTTVFAASLTAFYHRIEVGHVEAGLRTGNKASPFPEEINRVLTSHIADVHFAPTSVSRENLLREGVPGDRIHVTGNPVIDALRIAADRVRRCPPSIPGLPPGLLEREPASPLVLITGHRRENFGAGFESICRAIAHLSDLFPETDFVYPVHLNPHVQEPVRRVLKNRKNVTLLDPLGYLSFVAMMDRATLILTDSGGIQEEAPSLGKPVLVMREVTERPEALEAGTVKLVGTDFDRIVDSVSRLLSDDRACDAMARAVNPYGDGQAAERIVGVIQDFFSDRAGA